MKKIASIILAVLATIGFTVGVTGCSEKAQTAIKNVGGMIAGAIEENGISLKTVAVSADEVAATAESAIEVTATITPATATKFVKIDWSVAFKNEASTWASGKKVTDYVTVTPSSDGAKTATVTCLKAFGEEIAVKATVRGKASVSATVSCGYIERPETVSARFSGGASDLNFDFKKGTITEVNLTSSHAFLDSLTPTATNGGTGTGVIYDFKLKLDYSSVFTGKLESAGWLIGENSIVYSDIFSSDMLGSVSWRPKLFLPLSEPEVLGTYGEKLYNAYAYVFEGEGTITEEEADIYNTWRTALFETQSSGNKPVKLTLQQLTTSGEVLQEFVVHVTYDESIFPVVSANSITLNNGGITF